jgi:hypothetical protein
MRYKIINAVCTFLDLDKERSRIFSTREEARLHNSKLDELLKDTPNSLLERKRLGLQTYTERRTLIVPSIENCFKGYYYMEPKEGCRGNLRNIVSISFKPFSPHKFSNINRNSTCNTCNISTKPSEIIS